MRRIVRKRIVAVALLCAAGAVGPVARADGTHRWSHAFGSSGFDMISSATVDAAGDVVIAGQFSGAVDFGGGALTSAGASDIFVAKYSGTTGTHLWSKRFGGTGADAARGVATDAGNNIAVAGYFSDVVSFGGPNLASAGSLDGFVARYSATGTYSWARAFGDTSADQALDVTTDVTGNIIVAGYFNGTVTFGGAPLASAGQGDVFIAKYSSGSGHIWSNRYGGTAHDAAGGLATDAAGNIGFTGLFGNSASFGGAVLVSAGSTDGVIAKYTSAGLHVFSRRFGDTFSDVGVSVAFNGTTLIAGGYFQANASFGGPTFTSAGGPDAFLAAYDGAGFHQWSARYGGSSTDTVTDVSVEPGSGPVATGSFIGTVSFGGTPLTSLGGADVWTAGYTAAGAHKWSRGMGGSGSEMPEAIAATSARSVVLGGRFNGTASFGGPSYTSAGSEDAFLTSLTTVPPQVSIAETGGSTNIAEGGATDTYAVALQTQPTAPVTVTVGNAGGQVTASPSTLTFTTANWSTAQSVTVSAVNDAVDETTPHLAAIAHTASSADAVYNGISVANVTANITDNDTAGMTLSQSGGSTAVTEGGAADALTISLASQPTSDVVVAPSVASGQVTVSPSSVTFTPGTWNTPRQLTVTAVDDAVVESPASDTITTTVTSADPLYAGFPLPAVSVSVADNDVAGITIVQSGGSTAVTEGGPSDSYTVTLTAQPAAPVTIAMNAPGGQLTVGPSSLSFSAANWSTPQTVTVSAVNDLVGEPYVQTASVEHAASSADANFNGIGLPSVTVSVTDNDDGGKPASTFSTANGAILRVPPLGSDPVTGSSTDDLSGIDTVAITYAPLVGAATTLNATLTCASAARLFCSWSAPVPATPGVYFVRARATDRNGNVESPEPSITVLVI